MYVYIAVCRMPARRENSIGFPKAQTARRENKVGAFQSVPSAMNCAEITLHEKDQAHCKC